VILLPPPDLVVSSLEADNVYTTGSTMIIHFEVSNAGAGEPFEPFWRDQLVSCPCVTECFVRAFSFPMPI